MRKTRRIKTTDESINTCSISSLLSFCLTGTHTPNSKHKNIKHSHQRGKVLYHLGLLFFDILDSEVQLLATPPLHPSLCDIGNWACATLGGQVDSTTPCSPQNADHGDHASVAGYFSIWIRRISLVGSHETTQRLAPLAGGAQTSRLP